MRAFPVRLPSGVRYWTVLDGDLAVVAVADSFLRQVRFGRDGAESTTKALLAVALFAHDLAAFRVHAAAGLGGDGTCSLAAAASLAGHVDGGPGGPCPGCASGRGRLGLWFLVCCCGPGAGDP